MSPERAAGVMSMMTSPATGRQLTHAAGWTFDEAEAWLAASLAQLLLKSGALPLHSLSAGIGPSPDVTA
jgi:uncharacterized membrane protein